MPTEVLVDADLDSLRFYVAELGVRLTALEAASPPAPPDHSAEIAAIQAELQRLDSRLDAISGAAGD